MGLEVKRNKKGLYQLISTISDESYHPEKKWVSEDEAKRILITNALWSFIEKTIEIDACFPNDYRVNDIYNFKDDSKGKHLRWMIDNAYGENGSDILQEKFEGIIKKLDIDLSFNTKE